MDRIFILHADHEQNASTSTVRLAASSGANPFACIAAGIACLWGPAHGGANEAALNMLKEIGTPDRIPEYISKAKDKNDPFRLMGFGHRVYKNFDPRSRVMKQSADEVLDLLGVKDNPTLQVAKELEKIVLAKELNHGGNKVLRWMCSNLAMKTDPAGNINMDKAKSSEKIAGMIALVMALGSYMNGNTTEENPYDDRGFVFI